jgi:hypothetical protein
MTRRVLIFAVLAVSVLGAATASQAAPVNTRERAQQARLRQGLRSGALTGREYVRLEAREAHIRAEEFRYRHNDGVLGPRERADLQRDLAIENARIARQKHDGQVR